MKKLSTTKAELKKSVNYKKLVKYGRFNPTVQQLFLVNNHQNLANN